jgi:hypothetical protein
LKRPLTLAADERRASDYKEIAADLNKKKSVVQPPKMLKKTCTY